MSTHKHIDRICVVILALCLILTVLFMNGEALGIGAASRAMGYEETLFDASRVHTIDIVIDDWEAFLETCESETYSACAVVIDNKAIKNVAIRGKGNTSLSSVKSMGSQRYSFKIEFDRFEDGKSYYGLDKLSLNNIIQDNTYMKDFLVYRMMAAFGADAPLCSYVWITVNGEDWGLYLAVEGVEDAFLRRNYGRDAGELYKPDSMSFGGGGPGNGKDFNMDDFLNRDTEGEDAEEGGGSGFPGFGDGGMPGGFDPSQFSGGGMPEGFDPSQFGGAGGFTPPQQGGDGTGSGFSFPGGGQMPEGFDPTQMSGDGEQPDADGGGSRGPGFGGGGFNFGGIFGGMGSSDVKLQYSDDDPDSYGNIFDNAKTDVSKADQKRLIEALRKLNANEDIESVVDVDEVIRYFVVHNYVCNGDSYTGSIIHNYYLHESYGRLSMIPWDYNLSFGTFRSADATEVVNDPVDAPMEVSDASDRPMWGWIVASEEYTALYHQYFAEFLDTVDVTGIIDEAYGLIKSYVERDPTAFCTCEEFETGVATLRSFCELRNESVRGQLDGTIPSTDAGQRADSSALIDASGISISAMGSMGGGNGGGSPGGFGGFSGGNSGESTGNFPGGNGGGFGGGDRPSRGSDGDAGSQSRPDGGSGFGGGSFPGSGSGSSGFPGGGTGNAGSGSNFGGGSFPGGGKASGFPNGGSFSGGGSGAPARGEGADGQSRPDGGSGFGGGSFPGGRGETAPPGAQADGVGLPWLTLAGSAAVLAAGLLAAVLYRRRKR